MRIVFMGSPALACPALETLAAGDDEVVAVVTQPDRPQGRRLQPAPSAVKACAVQRGLAVLTPERVNDPDSIAALAELQPDLIVVVAFGQILKTELLALPPQGCVNLHTSLLPAYRGAAPIQWAIARGETQTGVTSMVMSEGLDEGDILLQAQVDIAPDETAGALHDRLAVVGANLLAETLNAIREGAAQPRPQDHAAATYAPRLTKADGQIDWNLPAAEIGNRVRGFNPWPGSFCAAADGRRLAVLEARREMNDSESSPEPGTVLAVDAEGPLVQTGTDAVRLAMVQPEGRRAMSGAEYLRGYPMQAGDRME